jgi:uncharacterized protein YggE
MQHRAYVPTFVTALTLAIATCVHADPPAPRLITVTGTAEIDVPPDQVVITCDVRALDKDILKAAKDADDLLNKILNLAHQAGIEDKNIQTTQVSIRPINRYHEDKEIFDGYSVSQTVALVLDDITKYRGFMTEALRSGLKNVEGIEFRSSKAREHREAARKQALEAAREKAATMAGVLGQHIGKPHKIVEDAPMPYATHGNILSNSIMAKEGPGDDAEGLSPGQIRITARVEVSFELTD